MPARRHAAALLSALLALAALAGCGGKKTPTYESPLTLAANSSTTMRLYGENNTIDVRNTGHDVIHIHVSLTDGSPRTHLRIGPGGTYRGDLSEINHLVFENANDLEGSIAFTVDGDGFVIESDPAAGDDSETTAGDESEAAPESDPDLPD